MVERHLEPLQPNQFGGHESQSVAKTDFLSSGSLSPLVDREQCSDSAVIWSACAYSLRHWEQISQQALHENLQEQIKDTTQEINKSLFVTTELHGIGEPQHARS